MSGAMSQESAAEAFAVTVDSPMVLTLNGRQRILAAKEGRGSAVYTALSAGERAILTMAVAMDDIDYLSLSVDEFYKGELVAALKQLADDIEGRLW